MYCAECEEELELDEPPNCYFTGRGPCGDCRDPRTNKPLNCFKPRLCEKCEEADNQSALQEEKQ